MSNEATATHGKNPEGRPEPEAPKPHEKYSIHIDRQMFKVATDRTTGRELRALPIPPIDEKRDLFQVVPGGLDELVGDDTIVEIKEGMHFVTAPRDVTPGAGRGR